MGCCTVGGECCTCLPVAEDKLRNGQVQQELTQAKRTYKEERPINILLIGLPGSGKTLFMQQLDLAQNGIWPERDKLKFNPYSNWIQRILVVLVEQFEAFNSPNEEQKSKYSPHNIHTVRRTDVSRVLAYPRSVPNKKQQRYYKKNSGKENPITLEKQLETVRSKHSKNPYPSKNISKTHPQFSSFPISTPQFHALNFIFQELI